MPFILSVTALRIGSSLALRQNIVGQAHADAVSTLQLGCKMIKLLAMSVFMAVGAIIGTVFFRIFANERFTLPLCIGLGILGAFAGMLLADLADIRLVGNLIDGLMFAAIGSCALLGLNLLIRR